MFRDMRSSAFQRFIVASPPATLRRLRDSPEVAFAQPKQTSWPTGASTEVLRAHSGPPSASSTRSTPRPPVSRFTSATWSWVR